jgi:hypothetical protein
MLPSKRQAMRETCGRALCETNANRMNMIGSEDWTMAVKDLLILRFLNLDVGSISLKLSEVYRHQQCQQFFEWRCRWFPNQERLS